MEESSPEGVDRGERVAGEYDPWRVPIVVDGAPATIEGILVYEEATTPLVYVGLAIIVAGLLGFYGRGHGLRLPAALLVFVSALALVVGWGDFSSTPDGGGNPLHWALAAIALLTALGALVFARRSAGIVLTLASVAALSGWALFRVEVLMKPVLPTDLPYPLDRTTVALALGVSVGSAIIALTSGALSLPSLADDEEEAEAGSVGGRALRGPPHQEAIRLRRSPTRAMSRPQADPSAPRSSPKASDEDHSHPIFLKRRQRKKQMAAMMATTM